MTDMMEVELSRQAFADATLFLAATVAADKAAHRLIVAANKKETITKQSAQQIAGNELMLMGADFFSGNVPEDAAWTYARKCFYLRLYKRIDAAIQTRIALPDPSDD